MELYAEAGLTTADVDAQVGSQPGRRQRARQQGQPGTGRLAARRQGMQDAALRAALSCLALALRASAAATVLGVGGAAWGAFHPSSHCVAGAAAALLAVMADSKQLSRQAAQGRVKQGGRSRVKWR